MEAQTVIATEPTTFAGPAFAGPAAFLGFLVEIKDVGMFEDDRPESALRTAAAAAHRLLAGA